jgi:hypothetical protein
VRGDLDVEFRADARAGEHGAARAGDPAPRGHPLQRAEHLHQRGQVVRADVEHWPAARGEQELRVRVPGVRSGVLERGEGGARGADPSVPDRGEPGLEAAAEEGVRGAAQPQAGAGGEVDQVAGVVGGGGQRLLRPDVPAALERGAADRVVRLRHGQVHHQLDRRIGQQLLDGAPAGHAELRGPQVRTLRVAVGDEPHHHVRRRGERPQVLLADHARADHAHTQRPVLHGLSSRPARPRALAAPGLNRKRAFMFRATGPRLPG